MTGLLQAGGNLGCVWVADGRVVERIHGASRAAREQVSLVRAHVMSFRMEVKQRSVGLLEFSLQVDRAVLSRDPRLCSQAKPSSTTLRPAS